MTPDTQQPDARQKMRDVYAAIGLSPGLLDINEAASKHIEAGIHLFARALIAERERVASLHGVPNKPVDGAKLADAVMRFLTPILVDTPLKLFKGDERTAEFLMGLCTVSFHALVVEFIDFVQARKVSK